MIQVDFLVSFMSHTAVYNLESAKWATIFNIRSHFVKKRSLKDRAPLKVFELICTF